MLARCESLIYDLLRGPGQCHHLWNVSADVAAITKIDLATAVDFDSPAAIRNIHSVRPGMNVLEVSAKTEQGMDEWFGLLQSKVAQAVQASG